MTPKSVKQIRHNQSRIVTHSVAASCPSCQNRPNASQSVMWFGDGSVTDFRERKAHKYREKLSLYLNPSRCHAHPCAMRAHAYKGGVTDKRVGFDRRRHLKPLRQFNFTAVAKRGSDQRGPTRGRIGTSGPDPSREARGNSHQGRDSLFSSSEL